MLSSSTMLNCGTLMVCVSAPYCFTMQMRFSHIDAYFTVISFCKNATILIGMSSTPSGSKDTAEMMCIMFVHMSHLLWHAYVRVPSYLRLTRCHSWPAIQLLFSAARRSLGTHSASKALQKNSLLMTCLCVWSDHTGSRSWRTHSRLRHASTTYAHTGLVLRPRK